MNPIKKYVLTVLFLIAVYTYMNAQYYEQAISTRFGTEFMIGYKKFELKYPKPMVSWEALIGLQIDERPLRAGNTSLQTNGYVLQGMGYWHYDIGFNTGFMGYLGAGVFMGVYTPQGMNPKFGGGVAAAVGMSYTFEFVPLEFSLDWMPILGSPRASLSRGALSLKYILKYE
jgi:hypothetical protein